MKTLENIQFELEELIGNKTEKKFSLVLHNDEDNTFNYVIDCLIEVCNHQLMQAEQCTLITHYKGKSVVLEGTKNKLSLAAEMLGMRGLTATVESK